MGTTFSTNIVKTELLLKKKYTFVSKKSIVLFPRDDYFMIGKKYQEQQKIYKGHDLSTGEKVFLLPIGTIFTGEKVLKKNVPFSDSGPYCINIYLFRENYSNKLVDLRDILKKKNKIFFNFDNLSDVLERI
jgi:hypothetical protein